MLFICPIAFSRLTQASNARHPYTPRSISRDVVTTNHSAGGGRLRRRQLVMVCPDVIFISRSAALLTTSPPAWLCLDVPKFYGVQWRQLRPLIAGTRARDH